MELPTHFKFTSNSIKDLPTKQKRYICHDTHNKSNGLKIEVMPSGKKFFRLKLKFNAKTRSFSLGEFGLMTLEEARNKAREHQSLLHQGIDPNIEKKSRLAKQVTLKEIFDHYLKSKSLSNATIKGYQISLKNVLNPLSKKIISEISYDMILKLHQDYSQKSKSESNRAMRLLRALFYFAMDELKDYKNQPIILENPVKKLFKNGFVKPLERKVSHLEDDQLKTFINYLLDMAKDEKEYPFYRSGSDLLLIMLFHGTRVEETRKIKKEMVDLKYKRFWLTQTKAKRKLWLPMTSFSEQIFKRRFELAGTSEYLFPSVKDPNKALSDTKKPLNSLFNETGIRITPHDLRRTFMTIGSRLNIGPYTLKQLANHSLNQNDVTAGYVIQNADELREPSETITKFLLGKNNSSSIDVFLNTLSKNEQQNLLKKLIENQNN